MIGLQANGCKWQKPLKVGPHICLEYYITLFFSFFFSLLHLVNLLLSLIILWSLPQVITKGFLSQLTTFAFVCHVTGSKKLLPCEIEKAFNLKKSSTATHCMILRLPLRPIQLHYDYITNL